MNPAQVYLDKKAKAFEPIAAELLSDLYRQKSISLDETTTLAQNLGHDLVEGIKIASACSTALLSVPAVKRVCLASFFMTTRGNFFQSNVGVLYMSTQKYLRVVIGADTVFVEFSGEELDAFGLYEISVAASNPHKQSVMERAAQNAGFYRLYPHLGKHAIESYVSCVAAMKATKSYKHVKRVFSSVQFTPDAT